MRYVKHQNTYKRYRSFQKKRFFGLFKNKRQVIKQNETRKYKNPFKRTKKNYRRIITLYILLIAVILWIGLLLYLPNFKIQKLEFEGLQIIKQEEIESIIKENFLQEGKFIPKNNFFLVRSKKIAKFLDCKFSLRSIEITKKFPSTLKINLKEKLSAIIYDNEKKYVLLGINGGIIKDIKPVDESEFVLKNLNIATTTPTSTLPESLNSLEAIPEQLITTSTIIEMERTHIPNKELLKDFSDYPILYDKRRLNLENLPVEGEEKNTILDKEFIERVIEFYEVVQEDRGVSIIYMEMEHPLAGIKITTDKEWFVWFQPNNNIDKQLNNLEIILKENNPRDYIDLRYEERVYWK